MKRRILIVDDEARIREVVEYALAREGLEVLAVDTGRAALAAIERGGIDLVVLDVMLPELDGLEVCRRVRAMPAADGRRVPILFLSARGEEIDRVLGLELGGDDYLVKPFSPRELVARVRALLRRVEAAAPTPAVEPARALRLGPLAIDLDRHEVKVGAAKIDLTRTELSLLASLLERPGIVLSRAQLVEKAYAFDNHVTERTIDTHVRRIRAKLRPHGLDPIATVHGVGYKASEVAGEAT